MEYRRATRDDLTGILDVWYACEIQGEEEAPGRPGDGDLFAHDLDTGDLFVAEEGGRIAGFSSSLVRGGSRFLANLFVRPSAQSAGVGGRLLEMAMPKDRALAFTVSSADHRAQALYIRHGMAPRWPNFVLRGEGRSPEGLDAIVQVVPAERDDGKLTAADREISGRTRPQDLAHLMDRMRSLPFWVRRGSEVLGYGLAQRRTPFALGHPDGVTVGPVGVFHRDSAAQAVQGILRVAAGLGSSVGISLPGPHPALPILLRAGFRIEYVELFLSSGPEPFDPYRYAPSGGDLY